MEFLSEIIVAAFGFLGTTAVAVIGVFSVKESRKNQRFIANSEKRAELRKKEGLLSMKLISSCVNLGIVTAKTVQHGKVNGDMEKALNAAATAEKEYQDFISELGVEKFVKY